MFATEPGSSTPAPRIPSNNPRTEPPPELEALRARADAAERALRESTQRITVLERQLATLVRANKDKPRPPRTVWPAAAGVAAIVMVLAAAAAWRWTAQAAPVVLEPAHPGAIPGGVTEVADTAEPASEPPPPAATEIAVSPRPVATPVARPARDLPAQVQQRQAPEPRTTYVGALSVDAVPGGEVFINRKSVGNTPVLLRGLRAGSHLVWIEREGYRRFTRVVLVPADKVSRVSVALERDTKAAGSP